MSVPLPTIMSHYVLKPRTSDKLIFQDNLFFHDAMDQLHEHVDREILPEEYGGALPKVENTQVRLASLKFEGYFKELKKLADDNRGRY